MTPQGPTGSTPPTPARTIAVVMAAGLGTRMHSTLPKVLHPLCGRPMLSYMLDAWASTADGSTGAPPVVVYSPPVEAIVTAFEGRATFALQAAPRGTGDAVKAALGSVPADAIEILVMNGDVPLVTGGDLEAVLDARRADDAAIALASVYAADPGSLGRVVRSEYGTVERIVEARDATAEELDGNEINVGLYAFDAAWLRRRIRGLDPSGVTGEFYLTELVRLARDDGRIVSAVAFEDDGRFDGINDRAELAAAEWSLRVRLNEAHMRNGVTMRDPSTVYLDWDVDLASDVTLEPDVILRGATTIGEGSVIGPHSELIDATIGCRVRVWSSVIERSTVEDDATIGPFSHLRPGCVVGRGAEVGNYAELKNTRLGASTKTHHMSYLGDATVGERVNIGAGSITANYDGTNKHATTIGDGAFIGVDTMLIAPVAIGDGAKTGAGSVVTHDVPAGRLAVGVPARIREPRARPPLPPPAGAEGQPAGND